MELALDKVFDSPRSSSSHPNQANAVGTYIFRKLGKLGLLIHMHQFLDREESSHGRLPDDVSGLNCFPIQLERAQIFWARVRLGLGLLKFAIFS